jgi:hypothetical protein
MGRRRRKQLDASEEKFMKAVNERVAKGEDIVSAFDSVEAEEIRARENARRQVLRQYEDILRSHGFVRRGSEGGRITYSRESSPEHEVALIPMSQEEIEWSYSSPKVRIRMFGKDPSSLDKTLCFHYRERVIQLGPSSLEKQ